MASIKARVDKLEGRGKYGRRAMHILRDVTVREGESLENAVSRAANAIGLDFEDIGYVELDRNPPHLELEYESWLGFGVRFNGYTGPIDKLEGYLRDGLPPHEWYLEQRRNEEAETLA